MKAVQSKLYLKYPLNIIPVDRCQYKDHPIKSNSDKIYTDTANGITQEIRICESCLREHVLRYYPNGNLAQWFRNNPEVKG